MAWLSQWSGVCTRTRDINPGTGLTYRPRTMRGIFASTVMCATPTPHNTGELIAFDINSTHPPVPKVPRAARTPSAPLFLPFFKLNKSSSIKLNP